MNIPIKLTVAEPWDFTSSDGENVVNCESDLNNKGVGRYGDWLIASCTPFVASKITVTSLLLTGRHQAQWLDKLLAGYSITVNGGWRADGQIWTPPLVASVEKYPDSIIGGFIIADAVRL